MAKFDLKEYARKGAEARVAQLNEELTAIYRAFPDLRPERTGRSMNNGQARSGVRRKRRKMSAVQRKAVAVRMKKYWAERRKAKKG